jgi:hypothetical protein
MTAPGHAVSLEEQIDQWRSYLRRRQAIHAVDVAELEDHLREQVAVLVDAGLAIDEAFLVAVKRMGDLDALSREFAREHSERLWKQLVVVPSDSGDPRAPARPDTIAAFSFALAAAVAIKVPALFGIPLEDRFAGFYIRNLSFFVLPLLTGYFVWKRRLDTGTLRWLAVAFVAAAVFANVYPFAPGGSTEVLTALHLPIALWLVVGIAYAGGRWREGGVAGLGVNVILLVNLAWSAVLYIRFLRGRGSFTALERWQTEYVPVYGLWAATVVIGFPPVFGYA